MHDNDCKLIAKITILQNIERIKQYQIKLLPIRDNDSCLYPYW